MTSAEAAEALHTATARRAQEGDALVAEAWLAGRREGVEVYVNGKLALTVEQAALALGKKASSVRATVSRHQIKAAGYVTSNVPVYYPEDLGLENRS